MEKICRHCFISGLVQGVFYRSHTKDEADKLGITGWVKNLRDGRVEAMICGEKNKIEKLIEWMKKGPRISKVDAVKVINEEYKNFDDFKIVY